MVRMRFARRGWARRPAQPAQPVAQDLGLAAHLRDPRPADPARGAARPHRDAQPRRAASPSTTAIPSRSEPSASGCAASTRRSSTRPAARTAPTIPAAAAPAKRSFALIGGRPVSCSGWERDKYDRLLATCTAGGGDLNRSQVEAGWAVAYGDYEAEQEAARRKGAGLWAGSFDRPRDWREMHGGMAESEHATPGSILDWLRQMLRFS